MSDNIPFDIQTEIIKRAPVKSVLRFRSVSKSWRSLIDSSHFISRYRTRKTQPRSLLVWYTIYDWYVKFVSVNSETFTQQQDLIPNVSALMKQIRWVYLIGYSHGLLCLKAPWVIVLWNPSIRRSVGISVSPYHIFGFVVCPVTNEPTIVKISKPWKLEVFTLSSKKWTVIQCSKPRESVSLHKGRHAVIDSCIYWAAYERCRLPNGSCTDKHMIVSFDLNAKEFKAIDLPNTITDPFNSPIRFNLSKLNGSLVVIVPRSKIKVWKMESDCSFTRLFTINTSCITDIVGFGKNGELVVETEETPGELDLFDDKPRCGLAVYDPLSKQITDLGMSGESGSFFISSYKETLLLLDHPDSCEGLEINLSPR